MMKHPPPFCMQLVAAGCLFTNSSLPWQSRQGTESRTFVTFSSSQVHPNDAFSSPAGTSTLILGQRASNGHSKLS